MDSSYVTKVVQDLSDLELAALVCLIAEQHCILRTPDDLIDDVASELVLSASKAFGFSCVVVDVHDRIDLEEFSEAVLASDEYDGARETFQGATLPRQQSEEPGSARPSITLDERKVANIVVAKHLNRASRDIQIQALELMRSRRIFGRTAVHATPKHFLFIALIADSVAGPPYLTPHLNDLFFISHYHDAEDGFPRLDAQQVDNESISETASIVRPSRPSKDVSSGPHHPFINDSMFKGLQKSTGLVRATPEMRRYIHNILTFMRLNRAVGGGVSALSSRHLTLLTRVLPPLHGLSYITPSLVALAARKVFPHRIEITRPEDERSMQWGSNLDAVAEKLEGVTPEIVIEQVLSEVEAPL